MPAMVKKHPGPYRSIAACRAVAVGLALTSVLCSCTGLSSKDRYQTAYQIASARDNNLDGDSLPLLPFIYSDSFYPLQTFERVDAAADTAVIYIEGDGLNFLSRGQVSGDPTPLHPLALRLARLDPANAVIYAARPCQYVRDVSSCTYPIWTDARMGDGVIRRYDRFLDQIRVRHPQIKSFHLVGYSGGGGVSVLLAAQRSDVMSIRTIAGNLDTDVFTRLHDLTPMSSSFNPADVAGRIRHVPQIHYVGMDDTRVPIDIVQSYMRSMVGPDDPQTLSCAHITRVPHTDHVDGWISYWRDAVRVIPSCR